MSYTEVINSTTEKLGGLLPKLQVYRQKPKAGASPLQQKWHFYLPEKLYIYLVVVCTSIYNLLIGPSCVSSSQVHRKTLCIGPSLFRTVRTSVVCDWRVVYWSLPLWLLALAMFCLTRAQAGAGIDFERFLAGRAMLKILYYSSAVP